jgi:hypothetical protein
MNTPRTLAALITLLLAAPAAADPFEHAAHPDAHAAAAHASEHPAADSAATDPRAAEMLLLAIDIPLTPETIERAGLTEAQAARVALDVKQSRYARVRALGALGVFGTDLGRRLIEAAAVADPDEQLRVQAVISLARVWGPDDRPTIGAFLVERLADDSTAVGDAVLRELERLYRK